MASDNRCDEQTVAAIDLAGGDGACFADYRNPEVIEHTARELVSQRVLALGYEDLNDHDQLCLDPCLAAAVGKRDPSGQDRVMERDKDKALASSSTSLSVDELDARTLYEGLYWPCGDMEICIKECLLELFAHRTSTQTLRANQTRLYFSSFAYVLMCALRRLALQDTELERAQSGTVRVRLLKLGAHASTHQRTQGLDRVLRELSRHQAVHAGVAQDPERSPAARHCLNIPTVLREATEVPIDRRRRAAMLAGTTSAPATPKTNTNRYR